MGNEFIARQTSGFQFSASTPSRNKFIDRHFRFAGSANYGNEVGTFFKAAGMRASMMNDRTPVAPLLVPKVSADNRQRNTR
jgi:hypothetical protein